MKNPFKLGGAAYIAYEMGYNDAIKDAMNLLTEDGDDGDNEEDGAAGCAGEGRGRDGSMLSGREETDADAGI